MTSIRIIGGSRRGQRLRVPPAGEVRPTGDRVREAVFDALGPVEDLTVLDLFAGSGALGFEALSRGARTATFVDDDPRVLGVLRDNARALAFAAAAEVLKCDYQDALAVFAARGRSFDLLFVDPPYRMLSEVMGVLDPCLPGVLTADGVAVVEGPFGDPPDTALDVVFQRRYGGTLVTMITKGRGHR
jgi:16S rRNA (guanine966-N2)-methyltransferase